MLNPYLIHYLEFFEHFVEKTAHMLGCAAFQRRLFEILEWYFEQINCFITIPINKFAFEHQIYTKLNANYSIHWIGYAYLIRAPAHNSTMNISVFIYYHLRNVEQILTTVFAQNHKQLFSNFINYTSTAHAKRMRLIFHVKKIYIKTRIYIFRRHGIMQTVPFVQCGLSKNPWNFLIKLHAFKWMINFIVNILFFFSVAI